MYTIICSKLLSYKLEQSESLILTLSSLNVCLEFLCALKIRLDLTSYNGTSYQRQCKEQYVATFTTIFYLLQTLQNLGFGGRWRT
jgi:hypothetical protein